jgi:hypothetical protein
MPLLLLCIIILLISISSTSKTAASDNEKEMKILQMFYREEELVFTPTRHPKPISQVAENITVITAEEIERSNAHTLRCVLNNISGVQVNSRGGPATASTVLIQGSDFSHALVLIDGVKLNNLSDNAADIAAIPVQYIERIEIIKGPASSSWGSSLGGVINIITKNAGNAAGIGGMLSGSFGEKNTGDYSEYNWPGNARELENLVERVVSMTESSVIEPSELDFLINSRKKSLRNISFGEKDLNLKKAYDVVEREYILKSLERNHWNLLDSARDLGISRSSLWRKIKKHRIIGLH